MGKTIAAKVQAGTCTVQEVQVQVQVQDQNQWSDRGRRKGLALPSPI